MPDPQQLEPIAVLPFTVPSSDPALAQLGVQVAEDVAAAIEGNNLGRVVRHWPEAAGQPFTERLGRKVLSETGAGTLLTGVIVRRGETLQIQAMLVRGSDLKTIWALGPEHASVRDPGPALDGIRNRVLGALGWYLGPIPTSPGLTPPPPDLDALRLVEKAFELFFAGRNEPAIPLFREAAVRDTAWLFPALWVGAAYGNLARWQERDSVLAFLEGRRARLFPLEALFLDLQHAWLASPEEELRAAEALLAVEPRWGAFSAMNAAVAALSPDKALRYGSLRDTSTAFGRNWLAWNGPAAEAYHMQRQFEAELALSRRARISQPRYYREWEREVRALAALGRTGEIDRIITESHGLEIAAAPVWLMNVAAGELSLHGRSALARGYAERTLAGVAQMADSLRTTIRAHAARIEALRILGRYEEVLHVYDREAPGLGSRLGSMRYRILTGDTTGALALVDSARSRPLAAFATSGWGNRGTPRYYAAQILSLLGRRDEAVAMLREAMNNGARLGADEPLQWYWAPIKDYPPFQELVKIR